MPAGYMSMPDVNKKIAVEVALETDKFRRKINALNMYVGRLKAQIERMKQKMSSANDTIVDGARAAKSSYAGWLGTALSLLFISQGIASATWRMIGPVLDILGLTDIWKVMLIDLQIEALAPIADQLMGIAEIFMDLPAPAKKLISYVILFAWALASVVGIAVQVLMLLGSIAIIMGGVEALTGAGIAAAAVVLATIIGWIAAAAGAIYALISTIWSFATGDWAVGIIKVLGIIVAIIAGIIAVVLGAPAVIVALIVGLVAFLIVFLIDNVKWFRDALLTFVGKTLEYLGWLFGKVFVDPIKWAVDKLIWLWEKTKGAAGAVKEWAGGVWNKAKGVVGLQTGGIVTRPTFAMLGESGPEAVVPLTGAGAVGPVININISGASFTSRNQMIDMVRLIQSALRDEMRRLGVR